MTFPHKIGFMKPKGLGYSPEYTLVYNSFTNKPSIADAAIQATMLDALVAGGYYAKAEFLDVFSAHSNTAGESQKNWKNPGTLDPTLVNSPGWVAYAGFTGNTVGVKYVKLNFNPTTNGTLIGQDNICLIWGVGNDVNENAYDVGGNDGTVYLQARSRRLNTFGNYCNNATAKTSANLNSIKHYAISRGNAANYDTYINLIKTNQVQASTGLVNISLAACGVNSNGSYGASSKQLRYMFLFSYLTEAEVLAVIGIMEAYLDNYGTGLY